MNEIDPQKIFSKYSSASRENLIPILQEFQDTMGFISEYVIVKVGSFLNLPTSKIYGLASFYNDFNFEQEGKYVIKICNGSACHIFDSNTLIQEIEKKLEIKAGETTRDGMFTLKKVDCLGACALAPVICINDDYYTKISPEKICNIIDNYINAQE